MTLSGPPPDPYGKALLDMVKAVSDRDGGSEAYAEAADALEGLLDHGDVPAGMLFYTCMYSALCHDIAGSADRAERMYGRMERAYAGEFDSIVGSQKHARRLVAGLADLGRRRHDKFSAALSCTVEWIKAVESRTGGPIEHDRDDEYAVFMSVLILLDDFFASMSDADADAARIASFAREADKRYRELELFDLEPPIDFMACLCLRLVKACSGRSVAALGTGVRARAEMLGAGICELTPLQKRAIDAGVLEGRSIVCASRGDGAGPQLACLALGQNGGGESGAMVYLASTRSRAHQAARQIGRILGGRLRVAVAAGYSPRRGGDWPLRDCDVVVATHEKMHELLRRGDLSAGNVGVVAVDDARDMGRLRGGADLGAVLALLRTPDRGATRQFVVLSGPADEGDVQDLANWLGAGVVEQDGVARGACERICLDGMLLGSSGEEAVAIPRSFYAPKAVGGGGERLRACYAVARWSMIDGASLLILTGGSGGHAAVARSVAEMLLQARGLDPDIDDAMRAGEPRWRGIAERIEAVDEEIPPHAATLADLARSGVLYYHAELGAGYRDVVEDAVQSGHVAAVVAPHTASASIGMQFDRVVFYDPLAGGAAGGGGSLGAADYGRLAGMAGSGGREGESILLAGSDLEAEEIRGRLWGAGNGAARLRSAIGDAVRGAADGDALRRLLLGLVAGGGAAVAAGPLAARLRSSWAGPAPAPAAGGAADGLDALVCRELTRLEDMGLVARNRDGLYAATPYGARAGASMLTPRSSTLVRDCLEAVVPAGLSVDDLDSAILATAGVAMAEHGMGFCTEEAVRVPPEVERVRGVLEGAGTDVAGMAGGALDTAAVLHCWTRSVPVADIMEKCGIGEGAAARIEGGVAADAAWILSAIEYVAAAVPCAADGRIRGRIGRMAERCLRGAGDDIGAVIAQAAIPGIGRETAIRLLGDERAGRCLRAWVSSPQWHARTPRQGHRVGIGSTVAH